MGAPGATSPIVAMLRACLLPGERGQEPWGCASTRANAVPAGAQGAGAAPGVMLLAGAHVMLG